MAALRQVRCPFTVGAGRMAVLAGRWFAGQPESGSHHPHRDVHLARQRRLPARQSHGAPAVAREAFGTLRDPLSVDLAMGRGQGLGWATSPGDRGGRKYVARCR